MNRSAPDTLGGCLEVEVQRDHLLAMLSESTEPAWVLARNAVEGARPYRVYAQTDRPLELVGTYKVRVATSSMQGVPTLGGDDLVSKLESAPSLAVGMVHGETHNIAFFLTANYTRCVSCWAVPNDWQPVGKE